MAQSFTTEAKVGAFTLASLGLVAFGYSFTLDGLSASEDAYRLFLHVPSADGIWEGTPVRVAGVDIGAVDAISVDGDRALLELKVKDGHPIPTDSVGELRSSGMLGERYIGVFPGRAEGALPDGGTLAFGSAPGDFDAITRQVEDISEDIKAITAALREVVEDRRNTEHIEGTLANVDALSLELRLLAEQNRADINAIVDSVGRLTVSLERFTDETARDVDVEMDKLHDATDALDRTLDEMESIAAKVDGGEGTLGALVNDRATIDALNETLDNANAVIESFSGLRAEVYYLGRAYVGSQPSDPAFFYGNPLAPAESGLGYSGSNTLGLSLHPQEDFWWTFEVNDYPQGVITAEERFYPDLGAAYTEWTRRIDYRFTFMMNKRWWNVSLRLGVKENGGGVGMSLYALQDRLTVSADLFDFAFGSYPALEASGLPNSRVGVRLEPVDRLWLEAGSEQILLGARYNYFTGYVGAGFHFSDDDIKLLFATLPLGL